MTRTRLNPSDRRDQLLRTGARLFAERPYDDVQIEEIASHAGVSRGLMYRYFATKRELFRAVVGRATERIAVRTAPEASGIGPGTTTPEQRLAAQVEVFLELFDTDADLMRVLHAGTASADEEVRRIITQGARRHEDHVLEQLGATPTGVLRAAVRSWIVMARTSALDRLDNPGISRGELREICLRGLLALTGTHAGRASAADNTSAQAPPPGLADTSMYRIPSGGEVSDMATATTTTPPGDAGPAAGESAPVTTRRARTRQRLLDAALDAFAEEGFGRTTIEQVCDRAGYSRGAFYSNFSSLDELFLAMWEQRSDRMLADLRAAFADTSAESPEEALRTALAAIPVDDAWYRVTAEFTAHALRNPPLRRVMAAREKSIQDTVLPIVAGALRRSGRRVTDEVALGYALVAVHDGTTVQVLVEPDDREVRVRREELFRRVLDAYSEPTTEETR
ncbi:TetR/AcrR family transcriptional regulator [Saccharopolyspora erythraea]|uniref:TetR/AcrR family transcriptional regulator n=1 Tax=Saccharopolyspora erythraea TaxID=1836 RepID=UPI001BA93C73|nr:TetR/AcrR family transcriptional regulator [Saccharopolyspora erythraea]QUH02429.1 TetR/AcrR family transcriptional regulator [Saccharopolyspora erythraea]